MPAPSISATRGAAADVAAPPYVGRPIGTGQKSAAYSAGCCPTEPGGPPKRGRRRTRPPKHAAEYACGYSALCGLSGSVHHARQWLATAAARPRDDGGAPGPRTAAVMDFKVRRAKRRAPCAASGRGLGYLHAVSVSIAGGRRRDASAVGS